MSPEGGTGTIALLLDAICCELLPRFTMNLLVGGCCGCCCGFFEAEEVIMPWKERDCRGLAGDAVTAAADT